MLSLIAFAVEVADMPGKLKIDESLTKQVSEDLGVNLRAFSYTESPVLAYSADGGGSKGSFVGYKVSQRCDHLTLGGDLDYEVSGGFQNDQRIGTFLRDKFPGELPISMEFGNHERGVEGSDRGHTRQIDYLSKNLSRVDPRFMTHQVDEDGVAEPFVDIFVDKTGEKQPFIMLHLDSDILPGNKAYQDKVAEMISKLQKGFDNKCNIVVSLHHAPETYNKRRTKDSDSRKYERHERDVVSLDIDHSHQISSSKPHRRYAPSQGNWNERISESLKYIYSEVRKQCDDQLRVIATQSGHDHFAHLAAQKNQPMAIIQGNGSQEGMNNFFQRNGLFGAKSQQAYSPYVRSGISKHKVYGVDDYRGEQEDRAYVRLGYGEWGFSSDGEPVYTQLRFAKANPTRNTPLLKSTESIFHADGKVTVNDFINHKQFTVDQGQLLAGTGKCSQHLNGPLPGIQVKDFLDRKIAGYHKFINALGQSGGASYGASGIYNQIKRLEHLSAELEGLFYLENKKYYTERLVKAFNSDLITLDDAVQLNRLAYTNKTQIDNGQFSTIVNDQYNQDKGFFRRHSPFSGATDTILHLREVAKMGHQYDCDVDLITRARAYRHNESQTSRSLSIFYKTSGGYDLSATEKVLENLGTEVGR
ncbi:MAG: hypothetical protein EP298_11805 [Gammaproteobacteria bacterium]|nr:MAG: hypothetical protein EP298_11805 [Gammaproteobacteria bacterium]UTW42060.1 hypothetical protein KFE69_11215 [bacterium SCSIO 12844]